MVTVSDAILAINPVAQFEYYDIENIFWIKNTTSLTHE